MNTLDLGSLAVRGLLLTIPATFLLTALAAPTRAQLASGVALLLALVASIASAVSGAVFSTRGALFSVRVDVVTLVMLLMVCGIGLVIVRYSRTYLRGDPGITRSFRWLLLTLAAVTSLVLANNLLVIALAWTATSVALHQLLTFYPDRTAALIAAHKKFLVSRLADVCLWSSLVLIHSTVGSLDLNDVADWATAHADLSPSTQAAALLVIVTVALKCAQLPFHGWLIQVMEAPTPVSALLHAGVVNIGAFVAIRLAPLLDRAPAAQLLLVVTGLVTAVVAALVMTTRVSVKVALAWSTCAQMGFMLVQCGLGAWHLALLHLVAHSFYKAHAFLSAGSAVDRWRVQALQRPRSALSLGSLGVAVLLALGGAAVAVAVVTRVTGTERLPDLSVAVLAFVVALSVAPLLAARPAAGVMSKLTLVASAGGVALLYAGWHVAAARLVPGLAAAAAAVDVDGGARVVGWVLVGVGFTVLFVVKALLELRPDGKLARRLHPWLFAGLYLDERFTRLTFRLWPPRLRPTAHVVGVEHTEAPAAGAVHVDSLVPVVDSTTSSAVDRACARIAPTWPLDRFIAVNPLWGMIDQPLTAVAAKLRGLSGAQLLMPRAWYRQEHRQGRLTDPHLQAALDEAGSTLTLAELRALLDEPEPTTSIRSRVVDVVDATRDLTHEVSWRSFVTHSVSQFCAAHFDEGQAHVGPPSAGGLYESWLRRAHDDRSPALLMGCETYRGLVARLPTTAAELTAAALNALDVPAAAREDYLWSLLLDQNGWASWCAYRRFNARLAGDDDDDIADLVAVRLAWEWLLHQAGGDVVATGWKHATASWPPIDEAASTSRVHDWLLQAAVELAWREPVLRALPAGLLVPRPTDAAVQAVFCIDVRSEVFRRALEATSSSVQTLGFAGFFGLPIDYQPLGAPAARPQLPGLLAPRLRAADTGLDAACADRRARQHDLQTGWKSFTADALSTFAFVEALGLGYAGKLVVDSLGLSSAVTIEDLGLSPAERTTRKPRLMGPVGPGPFDVDARSDLAAGMLRAMSLTRHFAPLVLLAGHGSATRNNPHAAGLDCGACCGQTGEVNARVADALLNDKTVRQGLVRRGIAIPDSTWFIGGLHNTTTDDVTLFDVDEVPPANVADVEALRALLRKAGDKARAERACALGLDGLTPSRLQQALSARTTDWAQVRAEWGLANNAALIVAPREHCQHLDLRGRSFLHEYRPEEDDGYGVLEQIMTAPMLVTHWINFQYYASTTENALYGSGNKVLHNVVGGHVGVFEGNGGDLRLGLPMQSLHEGERFVHTPLRLHVFIEAPRSAIDGVIAKHAAVRALVDNGGIELFQIAADESAVYVRRHARWENLTRLPPT